MRFGANREVLWDCYEEAVSSSKARAKRKAEKEFELASKDDAISKAATWVLTKQVCVVLCVCHRPCVCVCMPVYTLVS